MKRTSVQELVLTSPLPPTSNHRLTPARNRPGLVMSPPVRKWREQVLPDIQRQAQGQFIPGGYAVRTTVERPDRRRRDVENYIKHIGDALQEAGVIVDDALCQKSTISWAPNAPSKAARISVVLTACDLIRAGAPD